VPAGRFIHAILLLKPQSTRNAIKTAKHQRAETLIDVSKGSGYRYACGSWNL